MNTNPCAGSEELTESRLEVRNQQAAAADNLGNHEFSK